MVARRACLAVQSQGAKVLGKELLAVGSDDAADWAWREQTLARVFRREEPSAAAKLATARAVSPHKGSDFMRGGGLGLVKVGKHYAIYKLEFDGDRVVHQAIDGTGMEFMYAWERMADLAERTLLGDWRPR